MFVQEGTLYTDKDCASWTGDHMLRMGYNPKCG